MEGGREGTVTERMSQTMLAWRKGTRRQGVKAGRVVASDYCQSRGAAYVCDRPRVQYMYLRGYDGDVGKLDADDQLAQH